MDFITEFDQNTGTIASIDKEVSEIVFTGSSHNGAKIKIIGKEAAIAGSLTKIDMSNTEIEEICSNAFALNFDLAEVSFPVSLILIDENAFCRTNLKTINIPANVATMTGYAWNQIPFIQAFNVDENNQYFSSDRGYLFNKEKSILYRAPTSVEREDDIPNFARLDAIGEFAFTSTNIQYFTSTSKIRSIGIYCFHVTRKAVKIDLSQGKIKEIPMFCFCTSNASEILLPRSVETVSENSFQNVENLSCLVLYKKVKDISINAFLNCPKLKIIYYAGKSNFESIECFGDGITADVFVSQYYPSTLFCKRKSNKMIIYEVHNTCKSPGNLMKRRNYLIAFIFIFTK